MAGYDAESVFCQTAARSKLSWKRPSDQVGVKLRPRYVSRSGQVSVKHPNSRREDVGCGRRYAHIFRDGRTGQVCVPVRGQEDGRSFHS